MATTKITSNVLAPDAAQNNINSGSVFAVNLPTTIAGNLTVDTNTLFVDSSNNRVGIGTTAPQQSIDLRPILYVANQSGGIRFDNTSGAWPCGIYIRSDSSGNPRLSLDAPYQTNTLNLYNNLVGIGTTTPTQKLDVVGDIGVSNGLIMTGVPTSQSDVNYIRGLNSSTTVGFLAGTGVLRAADGPFFAARGNTYSAIAGQRGMVFFAAGSVANPTGLEGSLRFWTGSDSDRMIIDRTGNVGIGTTTPTSKLHIVDDWGTVKTSNSISSSFSLFPNIGNTTAFTIFRRGDTSNRAFTIGINATNGTEIGTNNGSISFNTSTLHLAAGVGGNVGIGTTTPNEKLTVVGNVSATGNLNIGGGLVTPITTINTNTTLSASNYVVMADSSSGNIVIQLPAASIHLGRTYHIKKIDSSTNLVTLSGNIAETIDGLNTQAINTQYISLTIVSNGSNWFII